MTGSFTMTSNRPYLLRAIHEWICDNGLTPYIVVDAGRPGVQVPPQAVSDGRVVLNLAPRAVARLEIGDTTITLMARFGGVSQAVSVPVAAVQAIYARENGQGMLLADDAPGTTGDKRGPTDTAAPASAPPLQVVPSAQDASASDDDPGPAPDGDGAGKRPAKGKPSLHVVK